MVDLYLTSPHLIPVRAELVEAARSAEGPSTGSGRTGLFGQVRTHPPPFALGYRRAFPKASIPQPERCFVDGRPLPHLTSSTFGLSLSKPRGQHQALRQAQDEPALW